MVPVHCSCVKIEGLRIAAVLSRGLGGAVSRSSAMTIRSWVQSRLEALWDAKIISKQIERQTRRANSKGKSNKYHIFKYILVSSNSKGTNMNSMEFKEAGDWASNPFCFYFLKYKQFSWGQGKGKHDYLDGWINGHQQNCIPGWRSHLTLLLCMWDMGYNPDEKVLAPKCTYFTSILILRITNTIWLHLFDLITLLYQVGCNWF